MNVEKGFRRLTATVSALILLLGGGAIAFDWLSSISAWRVASRYPSGELIGYVIGGGFATFPPNSSQREIEEAFVHLDETLQLESKGDEAVDNEGKELKARRPGASVSYLYLPGALSTAIGPPPGYVLDTPQIPPPSRETPYIQASLTRKRWDCRSENR